MDRPLPLADVRVLAVEQFGAGPYGSVHLADLGAEVIKIEDPHTGGDVGRYVPPYAVGEDSLFFETFNRNKLSVNLDMTVPAGRAVFEDLVRVSDAVYSNLRGDVPSALGITYSDLAQLNAMIVCCSLSGFGMSGPRRDQPGYDYVLQGMAGWMSLTGEPDGPPVKSGLSLVDYCGGFVAALALLAGVHAARRDGVGLDCDVSLFDTALSLLTYPGTWHLNEGWEAQRHRRSAHPSLSPFQNFPTSDGWIVIACPKDKFWRRLCEAIARPELATDTRFSTFEDRLANRDEVEAELDSVLATRTTEEWLAVLTEAGVPNGPVNGLAEALADPQTAARDMIVDTEHPVFGTIRQLASPVRVGEPRPEHRRAPRRHEDAAHVLCHLLGYDDDRVVALAEQGAFG